MRGGILLITAALIALSATAFAYVWSSNPDNGSLRNPYQIAPSNSSPHNMDDLNILAQYWP